jgi:hypothetical protein
MVWYEKNMLSKDFMSDVDLSSNEGDTLKDDPLASKEEKD